MSNLKALRDRRAKIVNDGKAVIAGYTGEGRDPTDEENAQLEALAAERTDVEEQIARLEARADMERGFEVAAGAVISGGHERIEDDPRRGFKHIGEFAHAVMRGSRPGGHVDDRLRMGAAPTSYGNEAVGSEGGFLVPAEFSQRVYDLSLEQDAFLPLTDSDPVNGNSMTFPADEATPWGTTGVRAYWEAEADQATQTKPNLNGNELKLKKLFALVPVTEELLADSSTIGSYIERRAGASIRYKTNDAFINGTGAGMPHGVMNAASTVSQAKETSQTAATINATNVAKMFGRCIGLTHWIINPDAYNQLIVMTIGDQPIWTPPVQGIEQAPNGLLLGRPVIMSDTCATLGTVGDIIGCNWMGYKTIVKAGGVQMAQSMHLWFDYDVSAFRWTFRVDGMPWLSAAISPAKGSVTRSHFVTLATRS